MGVAPGRAFDADHIPGPQPVQGDGLLELRSAVQQLRGDEPQPVHRPRAVPLEPPVLPGGGCGVVTMKHFERISIMRRTLASLAILGTIAAAGCSLDLRTRTTLPRPGRSKTPGSARGEWSSASSRPIVTSGPSRFARWAV